MYSGGGGGHGGSKVPAARETDPFPPKKRRVLGEKSNKIGGRNSPTRAHLARIAQLFHVPGVFRPTDTKSLISVEDAE